MNNQLAMKEELSQAPRRRTPLYRQHLAAGAKMVDFAGWDMPIHYGSQVLEHREVREHAGVFDVSHMTVVDFSGLEAVPFLRRLLSNDIARLNEPGKAMYSLMLNEEGGVVDDLIVYRMRESWRLVVNCATRAKDMRWMCTQAAGYDLNMLEHMDLAILAVHGPESIARVCSLLSPRQAQQVAALGNFRSVELEDWLVARTGYTGEKGLELIVPEEDATGLWNALLEAGVKPIGLGARDTLRLEAGMNLYGHDMDEGVSPLAANLEAAIAWQPDERRFIGRDALTIHKRQQADGLVPQLRGLVLEGRGVLREGQRVVCDMGEGTITSGGFSPTLNQSIALARLPAGSASASVDMRGTLTPVRIVKPNFVRFGRKVFE